MYALEVIFFSCYMSNETFIIFRIPEDDPRIQEALSTFSKPKALLWRVIQAAVSPNKIRVSVH